jgi:hypothetical protein
LATISDAIIMLAPGRFSTINCWPQASVSFWPTSRAT